MIFTRKTIPNFLGAMWRMVGAWVRRKPVLASAALREDRLFSCHSCIFYSDGQCTQCTCFVESKAALYEEKCPHDFWPVP